LAFPDLSVILPWLARLVTAKLAWLAVGVAGFPLTLYATRRLPLGARRGWALVAAGVGVVFATGVAIGINSITGQLPNPVWTLPGLLAYPLLVIGLIKLRRLSGARRSTDPLDALVVALGAFLIGWLFLLRHHFHAHATVIVATVGHEIGALIVLTMAIVVALGRGLGRGAGALLVTSAATLLAMTTILAVTVRPTTLATSSFGADAVLWAAFLLLVAAAGLTQWPPPPLRVRHSEPTPLTPPRIALILGLALLGPAIWVVVFATDKPTDAATESAVPVLGDAVLSVLLLMSLVLTGAALQRLRDHLRYQATHDALTGLGNRAALTDALDDVFAAHGSSAPTLLLLDLDGFKDVNDALGHPVGDAALIIVAGRLRQSVPAPVVLSRIGGDEFAVLLDNVSETDARSLADRICHALRQPYQLGDRTVRMSASIGLVPATAATPTEALRDADVALYAAKGAGRDRWMSYGDER